MVDREGGHVKDDYLVKFVEHFPTEEDQQDTILFVLFFRYNTTLV